MSESIELEAKYCAHNYHPLPVVLTRGDGAVGHGHANARLVELVQQIREVLEETDRMRLPS